MIEIYCLAKKLYKDAVFLKGQKSASLTWKVNREKWLDAIAEMHESVVRMGELLDYSYSEEHFDLIEEMKGILCACEKANTMTSVWSLKRPSWTKSTPAPIVACSALSISFQRGCAKRFILRTTMTVSLFSTATT